MESLTKKLNVDFFLSTTEHADTGSSEYVYIYIYRLYCCVDSTEIKTAFSIKTNTSSESGEISKKRSRRSTLTHVKACPMT